MSRFSFIVIARSASITMSISIVVVLWCALLFGASIAIDSDDGEILVYHSHDKIWHEEPLLVIGRAAVPKDPRYGFLHAKANVVHKNISHIVVDSGNPASHIMAEFIVTTIVPALSLEYDVKVIGYKL